MRSVFESAHLHVVQVRMKQAGQHWAEASGARMVALRAAYATAGPERFHGALNRALCATHLRQVKRQSQRAA